MMLSPAASPTHGWRRTHRAHASQPRAERDSVAVLDGSSFSEPATRQAADTLQKWGADRPILVVIGSEEAAVAKSFRNIEGVTVALADAAGVADVIGRPLAAALEPVIKQPCVIETKAGAAGAVGAQVAASAKPDG